MDENEEEALEALADEFVQDALAPYRGRFPPDVLAGFELQLRVFLLTHPIPSRKLARLRPRMAQAISGETGQDEGEKKAGQG
jgi:hypothetical protein